MEIEGIEEWEVEKILNKKKIREVEKYLVQWKRFMVEGDTWERKENLKNAEEALEEFEERMNAEVRRQERIDIAEKRDFRREELLGKFTAKMLLSQIRYSLVVILELNGVSEVQYKGVMMIDDGKYQ